MIEIQVDDTPNGINISMGEWFSKRLGVAAKVQDMSRSTMSRRPSGQPRSGGEHSALPLDGQKLASALKASRGLRELCAGGEPVWRSSLDAIPTALNARSQTASAPALRQTRADR